MLRLNLVSYFAACKYALPYLRKTRGSIINMSSLVGSMGQEWATTYVTTKGQSPPSPKPWRWTKRAMACGSTRCARRDRYTPAPQFHRIEADHPQQVEDFIDSWQWLGRVGAPLKKWATLACSWPATTPLLSPAWS